MQKNITLTVDSKTYKDYRDYCKHKGYVVSRQIELFMEQILSAERYLKQWNKKH